MPSPRAVLADIIKHNLDPKKPHCVGKKHLVNDVKPVVKVSTTPIVEKVSEPEVTQEQLSPPVEPEVSSVVVETVAPEIEVTVPENVEAENEVTTTETQIPVATTFQSYKKRAKKTVVSNESLFFHKCSFLSDISSS